MWQVSFCDPCLTSDLRRDRLASSSIASRTVSAVVNLAGDRWTGSLREHTDGRPVLTLEDDGPAPPGSVAVFGSDAPDAAAGWKDFAAQADWVHFMAAGIDGFPLEWLRGRTVSCARGVNANQIAEYIVAVILAAEKQLPAQWDRTAADDLVARPLGQLEDKTVGLIGFGTIGRATARRLQGFGVRTVAARRSATSSAGSETRVLPFHDVLAISDHLVLAAPLTAETDRMMSHAAFARLKRGAHLVNVARGRLVDTAALLEAIEAGVVARASLDVTDPEPLPAHHPLRQRSEVLITPHISWSAPATLDRHLERFHLNLVRWERGQRLEGLVDLDVGY